MTSSLRLGRPGRASVQHDSVVWLDFSKFWYLRPFKAARRRTRRLERPGGGEAWDLGRLLKGRSGQSAQKDLSRYSSLSSSGIVGTRCLTSVTDTGSLTGVFFPLGRVMAHPPGGLVAWAAKAWSRRLSDGPGNWPGQAQPGKAG